MQKSADRQPLAEVTNSQDSPHEEEKKAPTGSVSSGSSGEKSHGQKTRSNKIQVSSKKPANFYVFLSKMYLKEHETIEIHALGNAISTAVLASENLVR